MYENEIKQNPMMVKALVIFVLLNDAYWITKWKNLSIEYTICSRHLIKLNKHKLQMILVEIGEFNFCIGKSKWKNWVYCIWRFSFVLLAFYSSYFLFKLNFKTILGLFHSMDLHKIWKFNLIQSFDTCKLIDCIN